MPKQKRTALLWSSRLVLVVWIASLLIATHGLLVALGFPGRSLVPSTVGLPLVAFFVMFLGALYGWLRRWGMPPSSE